MAGTIVKEKIFQKKAGFLYVTKRNPKDDTWLDLLEVKAGRQKKIK